MVTRLDIVKEMRTWIGTPWKHQGRAKGIACDCLGIVQAAAEMLGQMPESLAHPTYSRLPHGNQLQNTFDEHLDRIEPEDAKIADLILFAFRPAKPGQDPMPMHVGLITPWRHQGEGPPFAILHAMMETGAVTEHPLDLSRMALVPVAYYRFKGLE